jgi:holo-[acyl-carrier protein] synthase
MDNIGIGVDIENIGRFRKHRLADDKYFLNKVFTRREINYCVAKNDPAKHLAARFAGKEAVLKALSSVCHSAINLSDYRKIEIINTENNAPSVKIWENGYNGFSVKISLSHCRDRAIAFVVLICN